MLSIGYCEGKGRGVFARNKFKKGDIIERAPVILIPGSELQHIKESVLKDYYFIWCHDKDNLRIGAIALGFGSLYNHSYTPNVKYLKRYNDLIIEFIALENIEEGEEITINYNGDPSDDTPMWFEVF